MEIFGTVRKVDATGRIALPAEMRRTLGLTGGDTVEIVSEGAALVLRKYQPTAASSASSSARTARLR